jgi:hypothetical protein
MIPGERKSRMFSNIKIFALTAAGIFVLVITLSVLGSMLEQSDSRFAAEWKAIFEKNSSAVFGTLFFLLCFTIVPVILRVFVRLQTWIGNTELPLVKFLQQHEYTVTYVVWGIMAVFILIMLPTIIKDMKNG